MKTRSQAGQAVTEYILVIAICIALVILFKQFYSAVLGPRIAFFAGGYIECLLETGQLPALGDAQAKSEFEEVARDDRCRMPKAGSYGGGGGGGNNGGHNGGGHNGGGGNNGGHNGGNNGGGHSGNNGNTKPSPTNPSQPSTNTSTSSNPNSGYSSSSSSSGNSSSEGGRADPTQSRGRASGYAMDRRRVLPIRSSRDISGTDGSNLGADGSQQRFENSAMDESGDEYGRGGRRSRGQRGYRGISGAMQQEIEKSDAEKPRKAAAAGKKIQPVAEGLGSIKESKRLVDPPPPRRVASAENGDSGGFELGTIFKFLLIAGVVIAIVIFFGSQIMNYTKSQEK